MCYLFLCNEFTNLLAILRHDNNADSLLWLDAKRSQLPAGQTSIPVLQIITVENYPGAAYAVPYPSP